MFTEIGHAGRTIVGDQARRQSAQGRQTGMCAGKDVDIGSAKRLDEPRLVVRIAQCRRIEAPAGERVGIAVHDGDPLAANVEAGNHRQSGECGENIRVPRRSGLEPGVDTVGAFDDGTRNVIRIGASATCGITVNAEFGLDIADDGVMGEHATIDLCIPGIVDIEPVEVTVENEGDRPGFCRRHALDGVERRQVAVEAADDIQGFGVDG